MKAPDLQQALADIQSERDPTIKHLKLASLCSEVFREKGIELVAVGGSAIEFYTEGAYTSGDVDLCVMRAQAPLTPRIRQELMGKLGATGGPRSWEISGAYVDVLGEFEYFSQTGIRTIQGPYGDVRLAPVEELIVERILVSKYPQDFLPARHCAMKLIAAALQNEVEADWDEVQRLARIEAYNNWTEVKRTIDEQARNLQVRSPYDSDKRAN